MRSAILIVLLCVLSTGFFGSAAAETPSLLEQLDPGTARAEVAESKGVFFVDVYAEW